LNFRQFGTRLFVLVLIATLQMQAAALHGRIIDDSGAGVPNVQVALRDVQNNVSRAVSRTDGTYVFPSLPAGHYSVNATAPQMALPAPVDVTVGRDDVKLDLLLRIVVKTEELAVKDTADAPTVSLDSSANAGAIVIKGEDLQSLADNPEDLQSDLQALAGPAAGPSGGTIYIDGFSTGQIPPKDSIREVRINQDPFTPEFDKLGFGRVEIFTKPGSSKFNGSIQYNFAHDFWNARNPYAAQKAPLLLQESENTVGGPLSKKASFTLEFEYHAVDNGSVINAIILDPTSLQKQPFNGVSKALQRHILVSPRVDYQLSENNTLTLRYSLIDSSVRGFGIGQFDLASRGYRLANRFDTVQVGETYVAGAWVNDFRYQYYRWKRTTVPSEDAATVQVLGAFTSGGAQVGSSSDVQTSHELQNYVSLVHGAHTWRFGVRLREAIDDSIARASFNGLYTFSSLDAYQTTLKGLQAGLSPAAIRAAGGGASQYSITAGVPGLRVSQFDAGIFAGDNWRVRPNLLLNLGIRYENQTNLSDNANLAPRIGIAWSPKSSAGHATVLRAGFGIFYDRFALANIVTAGRYNGVQQQQYVLMNPDTFPAVLPPSSLIGTGNPQVLQRLDSKLSAPYVLQSAVTLEQQVTRKTTLSVSYTNSRAVHVLRSLDINAPLPGSGIFPYGTASPVYLATTSGIYNQNQLIASMNLKPTSRVSLFGYYVLNRAMSNSDGLMTFPANPYNFSGEYGPAATDIRHRVLVGGSMGIRWNIRLSPYVIVQSGAPFDITTGRDLYGTALFNTRPGIATGPGPGIVNTSYGFLDSSPISDEVIVPRNAGRGPGLVTFNLRLSKTFGFGRIKGGSKDDGGTPQIDATRMSSAGGLRGLFSSNSSERRYSLTVGMSARNLTNHNNAGPIIGNITSALFGRSNQIAGTPNGEGFSESASNRRLELQIRFSF
jgi:hypothetical protein